MDKELEKQAKKIDRFLKTNLSSLHMVVCVGSISEKAYKLTSFRRTFIPADKPALRSLTIKSGDGGVCKISKPAQGIIEEEPPRLGITFVLGRSSAGNILHESFYEYGSIKLAGDRLMCSRIETICIPKPKQDNIEQ